MAEILKTLSIGGADYTFDAEQFGGKTVDAWEKLISGAVDYLGLLSSEDGLSTTAGYGDFYRVLKEFTTTSEYTVHAGDLVICNVKADTVGQTIGTSADSPWIVVHGEEGNLISHTHSYTPAGTVNSTFTGTSKGHTHTFTGTKATLNQTITPTGTITINGGQGYTPAGSINAQTFTGTAASHTHILTTTTNTIEPTFSTTENTTGIASGVTSVASGSHTHTLSLGGSSSGSYTPTGNVSLTKSAVTFNAVTSVGTLPTLGTTYDSTSHKLTLNFNQGTLPSTSSTSINNVTAATFTGKASTVSTSLSGTITTDATDDTSTVKVATGDHTHTYKVIDEIDSFDVISGVTANSTSITPAGTVSQATFTGTKQKFSGSFSGEAIGITMDYIPEGTITETSIKPEGTIQSTFTGTPSTTTTPSE